MEKERKIEILTDGIYSAASNLNAFILASAGLLILIVCLKYFSKENTGVKIPNLDFVLPWNKIWIILAAYTVGHFYFAFILNQRIEKLKKENATSIQKENIWENITNGEKSGFIFSGMESRNNLYKNEILGITIYEMQRTDITTWISIGITLLLFLSVFNHKASLIDKFYSIYYGLLICSINWLIGSWWAINISNI